MLPVYLSFFGPGPGHGTEEMQHRTPELEAVLLYEETPEFAFDAYLERLNDALSPMGIRFGSGQLRGDSFTVFVNPERHLLVTVNDSPLAEAETAEALAAPITRIKTHDYAAAVAAHRHTVRLALGAGPQYGFGQAADGPADASCCMRVLHRAVLELMAIDRPCAVYWAQSDLIFTPKEIERAARSHFPAGLVLRPVPFKAGEDADGKPLLGLRAEGAELFCGKPLVIDPGEGSLSTAIAVAEHLVTEQISDGDTLRDGATMVFSEDTRLHIRHESDGGDTPGTIHVRLAPATAEDLAAEADAFFVDPPATRSAALRSYALCAALAVVMPVPAAALFLWNYVRGPNLFVTAAAYALALAFFTGSLLIQASDGQQIADAGAATLAGHATN